MYKATVTFSAVTVKKDNQYINQKPKYHFILTCIHHMYIASILVENTVVDILVKVSVLGPLDPKKWFEKILTSPT